MIVVYLKFPGAVWEENRLKAPFFNFFAGVVWTRPNASKMYNLNNAERLMLYTDWILALNVDYFQVRSVNASVVIFFILSRYLDVLTFSLF